MDMEIVELKDKINNLQNDMEGMSALVHAFLEGIRSGSVSIDEITNATAMLYQLVDIISVRIENAKKDLSSIS